MPPGNVYINIFMICIRIHLGSNIDSGSLPECHSVTSHLALQGLLDYEPKQCTTVGGRHPAPVVTVGSLSHPYLQGFIHPRWLFRISSINSSIEGIHQIAIHLHCLIPPKNMGPI